MKLKNFFNNERKNAVVRELKNDFMPLLEKVTVPVTKYATRNPRATFAFMMLIVIINIIILFHYTNAFVTRKGMGLTDMVYPNLKFQNRNGTVPDITVSFENIRKVRLLQDSLSYLLALRHMTFQDTLTFVRVMDAFQKISSGSNGIPPLQLDDLRKMAPSIPAIIDTTHKKNTLNFSK